MPSRVLARARAARVILWRLLPRYLALTLLKRFVPLQTLTRWAWRTPSHVLDAPARELLIGRVFRLSALLPWGDRDCLQRSLLLYSELARAGADPSLAVGFRRRDETLEGHAWVLVDGQVVSEEPPATRQFRATAYFGAQGRLLDASGARTSP